MQLTDKKRGILLRNSADNGRRHILQNGILLVGMEPADVVVATEPGHLLAGVDAAVLLYLLDGKLQGTVAVEVGKEFLVAHGVE